MTFSGKHFLLAYIAIVGLLVAASLPSLISPQRSVAINTGMMGQGMMGNGMMGGMMNGGMMSMMGVDYITFTAEQVSKIDSSPASVDREANAVSFHGNNIRVTVFAGHMIFMVDGLADPELIFPNGAKVTFTIVNIDNLPHTFTITNVPPPYPYMAGMTMMSSPVTTMMISPRDHSTYYASLVSFTALGNWYYVCAVMGHAQRGMFGEIAAA